MATRRLETEIALTGEKQFNDAMKSINSNLKTLRSEMAVVTSEFDQNAGSVDALSAKQKVLQQSVDQHRAKVEALQQMYQKQVAAYGENSAAADKYKQQLNNAIVALNKESAALRQNEAALAQAQSETEQAAEGMDDVADAAEDAARSVKRSAESVEDLGEKSSKTSNRLASLAKGVGTVGGGIAKGIGQLTATAAAGAAALGVGGVAALTLVAETARESAEAAKAAQESGQTLTATQQQWLAYSGQLEALDASVANAKSALIGVLLPVLGDLSTKGGAFLDDFSRDMAAAGDSSQQAKVIAEYIRQGAQLIKENLPEYIESGREIISGLKEGLSEYAPEFADSAIDLVFDFLEKIVSEDSATALEEGALFLIEKLKAGLQERGPDIAASSVNMVVQLATGLLSAAPGLVPVAGELIFTLLMALIQAAPELFSAGLRLIVEVVSGILSGSPELLAAGGELVVALLTALGQMLLDLYNIGTEAVDKLKNGIADAWDGLVSWFKGIWDSLFGNLDVNVGISGSSGRGGSGNRVDGFHAGGLDRVPFDGYIASLHKDEMILNRAQADLYRKGTGTGTKIFNMTIHTHSLSQSDVDMLVEYMNGKLGDDL